LAAARTAFMGLAWLFVLGVAVQFFLAGLGLSELGGESMDPHEALGHALTIVSIVLLLLAVIGHLGRLLIGLSVVLFLLVFFQSLWANEDLDPMALRSLHVLGGLAIFVLGHYLAQQATRLVRGEGAEGARGGAGA